MTDISLFPQVMPDELFMVVSRGGRVLFCSKPLTALLGVDLQGKNLTDIVEDRVVSQLIINSNENNIYEFDCVINDKAFECGAKLSESGNIVIVLTPSQPDDSRRANADIVRYLGREINANVESMGIAFGALNSGPSDMRDYALGLWNRSMMNLARVSKNAVTKVDSDQGTMVSDMHPGDLAGDISEVCGKAADFCRDYAEISFRGYEQPLECLYDPGAVKRIILNLISYCISRSSLKFPRLSIVSELKNSSMVVTFSLGGDGSRTFFGGEGTGGADSMEIDIAVILAKMLKGSIVVTERKGGSLCRLTLPIVKADGYRGSLSSTIIDWYGGMDMVATELSWVMPPEAYTVSRLS